MEKFLLSKPGLVITGIGTLAILWIISRLLGASIFFICALVVVFLLALITYLVLRLHDELLLEKIKPRLRLAEPKEEEKSE